ncbi:hypothetical protein O999_17475 [Pseudomonas putida LF54]|nr:hypothetical protein O999_17475 [Pseudomonas putida LF54]
MSWGLLKCFGWRWRCSDVEQAADAIPADGDGEVVGEQNGPERQLPVLFALHFTGLAGSPGGIVAPGFGRGQADGVQWLVPPVGFTGRGEFVRAVVHEVAQVFPHFGDMLDAGFGGFVAVDPEAVFLMQAAVFPAGGEGEGIAGAER